MTELVAPDRIKKILRVESQFRAPFILNIGYRIGAAATHGRPEYGISDYSTAEKLLDSVLSEVQPDSIIIRYLQGKSANANFEEVEYAVLYPGMEVKPEAGSLAGIGSITDPAAFERQIIERWEKAQELKAAEKHLADLEKEVAELREKNNLLEGELGDLKENFSWAKLGYTAMSKLDEYGGLKGIQEFVGGLRKNLSGLGGAAEPAAIAPETAPLQPSMPAVPTLPEDVQQLVDWFLSIDANQRANAGWTLNQVMVNPARYPAMIRLLELMSDYSDEDLNVHVAFLSQPEDPEDEDSDTSQEQDERKTA